MLLLRLFSLIIISVLGLGAKVLDYKELKDKPKSLVKDYYINRLINEGKYTKSQIQELSKDIFRNGGAVKKSIDTILPPKYTLGACSKVGIKNILDANTTCQNMLTSIAFSLKLDNQTRQKLAINLANEFKYKSQILLNLNSKNPALTFAKQGDIDSFVSLFKASSQKQKDEFFGIEFDKKTMDMFYNAKGFTQILINLVLKRDFDKFRQNLLKITPEITEQKEAFFLGLNAITLDNTKKAKAFFKRAADTYKLTRQKDNANFWLYLLGDKSILNELTRSNDINIYSLYAKELTHSKPFNIYVPRPKIKKSTKYDITNPFVWQQIADSAKDKSQKELEKIATQFYSKDTVSAYVYFMQKASNWEKNYFIIPENESLNGLSSLRKSMIFSLARQESLFLPSVISTSYALGTMQFMPFLANAIGKKELKIPNFDQDAMFNPTVAYRFANHHLDYLEKYLKHPLFIAYAYNGGIGFTKRLLLRDDMFKNGKFEPFLSMELIPYSETRLYGKKVLANYVVYRALTGSNIKISRLFEILTQPALTDNFRK